MKLHLVFAAGAFLLAGCSTVSRIDDRYVDYNNALEQSVNLTVLMNAVRASERMPPVYSRMGSLTYTNTSESNPSIETVLGAGTVGARRFIGPDGDTLASNPGVTSSLGVKNTGDSVVKYDALLGEEFYKAILTSIGGDTVSLYRDQGWPDPLLFLLFIERIEFKENITISSKGEKEEKDSIIHICGDDSKGREDRKDQLDDYKNKEGTGITLALLPVLENDVDEFCENTDLYLNERNGYHVIENDPLKVQKFEAFFNAAHSVSNNYNINLIPVDMSLPPVEPCLPSPKSSENEGSQADARGNSSKTDEKTPKQQMCARLKNHVLVGDIESFQATDIAALGEPFQIYNGKLYKKVKAARTLEFKRKDNISWYKYIACPGTKFVSKNLTRNEKNPDDPENEELANYFEGLKESFGANVSPDGDDEVRVILRSPDSIVYYLGEILRAQYQEKLGERMFFGLHRCELPNDGSDEGEDLFFVVNRDESLLGRASDTARFEGLFAFELYGKRYSVSEELNRRGRTMQVVNLVNQIFAQKQNASEAPAVTTLRVQ